MYSFQLINPMKNNKIILLSLCLLLTAVGYFTMQAWQKKGFDATSFSGEWKAKESIGLGGNIVCSFVADDRMNANVLKIAEQANFLTIETKNAPSKAKSAQFQEKLTFNGQENQSISREGIDKKYTVKLSADRKTMTIHTTINQMVATPYHANVQMKAISNVTEVWHLSQDGKSISVRSKAKSTLWGGERAWVTVFEKVI
ncbi:MAG: hypothetical protein RLZ91_825 [Bacteroidota bacterium]